MTALEPDDRAHLPDPKARALWMGMGAVAGALIGAVVALPLLALDATWAGLAVLAALIVAGAAFGRAVWRRRSWLLDERSLELRRGVIVHRVSSVPYTRIQQIDVQRGPVERLIGLAQLKVRTAAAATDGTIYGLAVDDASLIRRRLLDLAGVDDAV